MGIGPRRPAANSRPRLRPVMRLRSLRRVSRRQNERRGVDLDSDDSSLDEDREGGARYARGGCASFAKVGACVRVRMGVRARVRVRAYAGVCAGIEGRTAHPRGAVSDLADLAMSSPRASRGKGGQPRLAYTRWGPTTRGRALAPTSLRLTTPQPLPVPKRLCEEREAGPQDDAAVRRR